jgi:hypothetical protein
MKAFDLFRFSSAPLVRRTALLLLLLPLALAGCGDVEDTNPDKATDTLNPSASFRVTQTPPSRDSTTTTTNVINGVTNTTTTVTPAASVTALDIAATDAGGSTWTVQATDNTGGSFAGTASGPSLRAPPGDNTYPAGATIASFSLQCANLSGEITAVALVPIPLDVVRTSTTNGTNVVTGRHGQHSLTPQNTEYRLAATLNRNGRAFTLSGQAPIAPATIQW